MGQLKEDTLPTPGTEVPTDAVTTDAPTTEASFEKEIAADAGLTTLGDLDGI